MKKLTYILSIAVLSQLFVACENIDFGDTNENLNGAASPYTAGLLSGAIMDYATLTGRDGLMKPTLYVQYQSQVTYTTAMQYEEVPTSWYTYYVGSLSSLNEIIEYLKVEENLTPAVLSQGSVENQTGVAMIMKAIIMKRVTDNWGDAPYSEAFKGTDNIEPAYDTQESIYNSIIAELKAGRDMLDASTTTPSGDIIYGGDVDMWAKLANSAILQASLQLSGVYPTASGMAATEFNAALSHSAGVIETVAEEAWFTFEDIAGFRNPWNQNRTPDYFMSKEFSDALKGNTTDTTLNPTSNSVLDARINVYSTDPTLDGVPYGYANGTGAGAASISNDNYWNNTTPLPLMTASYVALNRAEAAAMGWTSEDATALLTDGITLSYASLDAHFGTSISADAAAYAAARVADVGTAGLATVIAEEKWVSLFGQGFDAWAEWRRTGIPSLTPATDAINDGNIPTRYLYPTEEATLNGGNYNAAVSNLSGNGDKGTSKIWWDQ